MKPAYTLGDGEARHAAHPETFYIPTIEERQQVQVGHYAKLIFSKPHKEDEVSECMWVQVTHVNDDGSYRGTIANGPVVVEAKYGDAVTFEPKHIIDITE